MKDFHKIFAPVILRKPNFWKYETNFHPTRWVTIGYLLFLYIERECRDPIFMYYEEEKIVPHPSTKKDLHTEGGSLNTCKPEFF